MGNGCWLPAQLQGLVGSTCSRLLEIPELRGSIAAAGDQNVTIFRIPREASDLAASDWRDLITHSIPMLTPAAGGEMTGSSIQRAELDTWRRCRHARPLLSLSDLVFSESLGSGPAGLGLIIFSEGGGRGAIQRLGWTSVIARIISACGCRKLLL